MMLPKSIKHNHMNLVRMSPEPEAGVGTVGISRDLLSATTVATNTRVSAAVSRKGTGTDGEIGLRC